MKRDARGPPAYRSIAPRPVRVPLRDVDENNRLRRCLAAGSAGGASARTRSRLAVSSCHGGSEGGGDAARWRRGRHSPPALFAGIGRSRSSAKPSFSCMGSRTAAAGRCGAAAPSPRAILRNSRSAIQMPIMIAPVQFVTAPVMIKVLPKLNSLTGRPTAICASPARKKPIPAINNAIAIELSPAAPKTAQPPMPRYRHIPHTATGNCTAGSLAKSSMSAATYNLFWGPARHP